MEEPMNILILSCGTRNKIVQYFKETLGNRGQVMATDCSELAPALYEADKNFIVPRIDALNYLDTILEICRTNHIKGVISLIDPELSLLAKHREDFISSGTTPIISDYDLVELSFDKYQFYEELIKEEIKAVKTYKDIEKFKMDFDKEEIEFPVFVKPIRGSASININKVYNFEELEQLFKRYDNLIIQEYMDGKEFGADVYIDILSGELVSVFIKEKIAMRAGETDKSVSVKDDTLLELIKKLVSVVRYRGIIDVDIFQVNGEYYISEVNPRFGGGYPHAYECGVNIPEMIITNLKGQKNKSSIGKYDTGKYMMKYNEVCII